MPAGKGSAQIQMKAQPVAVQPIQHEQGQYIDQQQAPQSQQYQPPPVQVNGGFQNNNSSHEEGWSYQPTVHKPEPLPHVDPPQFVQPLENEINAPEGEPVHLETHLATPGDNNTRVEWFKNGRPLITGTRFNSSFDRGQICLDILYTFPEDSGEYVCVVANSVGQCQTNVCRVHVLEEENLSAQHSAEAMAAQGQYEPDSLHTRPKYDRDEDGGKEPPKFLKPLLVSANVVNEGEPVHFETLLNASNDSSLHVDWFKNGQQLSSSCRFNIVYDRGYAVLDLAYCIPEDEGDYICVARNALGQAQSNSVHFQCVGGEAIITKSNLSENSIQHLTYLENPEEAYGNSESAGLRYHEDQELETVPHFDVLPESCDAAEGGPARFLVKVSGFPRPRITWFVDGDIITSNNTYKIYHDGAINVMEIFRCKDLGVIKITAIARSTLGEARADATLNVVPAADFRPDLKHVQPENTFKRLQQLRKVDCTPELKNALVKPKASFEQLRHVERDGEIKARTFKSPEVLEAEDLYTNVQSKLKGGAYQFKAVNKQQAQNFQAPAPSYGKDETEASFNIEL